MQDLRTGELVPLDYQNAMRDIIQGKLQEAKDKAIPQREFQGPVFSVGEILDIKGGRFQVQRMRRSGILVLKGLPR
jgi:hypothetical protein